MRLYLAYSNLITIFKIDFIALTMTSQWINAWINPIEFLVCYSVLAFTIHLPAVIIKSKIKN